MQLRIVRETGYLKVELQHRETAEEMREAIWKVLGECRRHGISTVLVSTRASRPLFKLQEFGLSAAREFELLREYQDTYGRLPRMNAADAA